MVEHDHYIYFNINQLRTYSYSSSWQRLLDSNDPEAPLIWNLNVSINSSPLDWMILSVENKRSCHHRNIFQNLLLDLSHGGHMGKVTYGGIDLYFII